MNFFNRKQDIRKRKLIKYLSLIVNTLERNNELDLKNLHLNIYRLNNVVIDCHSESFMCGRCNYFTSTLYDKEQMRTDLFKTFYKFRNQMINKNWCPYSSLNWKCAKILRDWQSLEETFEVKE